MLSLSSMLHLELPHINVLSKVDNLEAYGELPFDLDVFKEATDLEMLSSTLANDSALSKYKKLTEVRCMRARHAQHHHLLLYCFPKWV